MVKNMFDAGVLQPVFKASSPVLIEKRSSKFFKKTQHYSLVMASKLHVFSKTTCVLTRGSESVYCITVRFCSNKEEDNCNARFKLPTPVPQRDCGTCPSVYSTKMPFGGCSLKPMMTKPRQVMGQGPGFANVLGDRRHNYLSTRSTNTCLLVV